MDGGCGAVSKFSNFCGVRLVARADHEPFVVPIPGLEGIVSPHSDE